MSKSDTFALIESCSYYNGRKSIRLKKHDYASSGFYFITVCCKNMRCSLGHFGQGNFFLSDIGKLVEKYWIEIPRHHPHIELNDYIIMPNHIHGIIEIKSTGLKEYSPEYIAAISRPLVGAQHVEPLQNETIIKDINLNRYQHIKPGSLGTVIRGFKAMVKKTCKENGFEFEWQRNYHDRIIKNPDELKTVRKYMLNNPIRWLTDTDYRRNNEKRNLHR